MARKISNGLKDTHLIARYSKPLSMALTKSPSDEHRLANAN